MIRLLFWIALVLLVWFLWRQARPRPKQSAAEPHSLPMVRCAHCQVHVPQHEALQSQDYWYCSPAHLEQARTDRGN